MSSLGFAVGPAKSLSLSVGMTFAPLDPPRFASGAFVLFEYIDLTYITFLFFV